MPTCYEKKGTLWAFSCLHVCCNFMLFYNRYALATSIEKELQDVTEALKDVFVIINKDLIAQADDLDQNVCLAPFLGTAS